MTNIVLKNLTIRTRLRFVLGFLGLQLVLGAVIGIVSLKQSNEAMKSIYDNRLVALGQLDKVIRLMSRQESGMAKAVTAPPGKIAGYVEGIRTDSAKMEGTWHEYMATSLTPEEKVLATSFTQAREEFQRSGMQPALATLSTGDMAAATALLHEKIVPLFENMREPANKLIALQLTEAAKEQKAAEAQYILVRNVCIVGVVFSLFIAISIGVWLVRSIIGPLNRAVEVARLVAAGDLTSQIDVSSNDETGQLLKALKSMTESLMNIVQEVRTGTDTMVTASLEIAAGNSDLSVRTEQQAASLEETASSMEELTATVKQNAENAQEGNTLAGAASDIAKRGGLVVDTVIETMAQITQSAHQIGEITSVIDGIAFQTNLLALNAAVEAARAGEQGRGFAVVATEVRALARRSADAAKEIKTLIAASGKVADEGTRQVKLAGATMGEIRVSVGKVTGIMAEISVASREQSAGIEQINQAVLQMDQVTQQNAALVEEAAAAAMSLKDEADRLAQAVSIFKIART